MALRKNSREYLPEGMGIAETMQRKAPEIRKFSDFSVQTKHLIRAGMPTDRW